MAAEKVITTTHMCVGTHVRLMAAEKVITMTTKLCVWEHMHVKIHCGQMHVERILLPEYFLDVTFV
jgi:hypothetical protein